MHDTLHIYASCINGYPCSLPRIHPGPFKSMAVDARDETAGVVSPRARHRGSMFAAPPPEAPTLERTGITAAQQSDLDCLSIGTVMGKSAGGSGISPWASRLVRIYLARLE